jgi:hypothetical protein
MNSSKKLVVKAAPGVVRRMREDLSAQEAVFGGDVPLDVDEAQDATGVRPHRMPDEVETPDPCLLQHNAGGLHLKWDRYFRQVVAGGLAASRCVVGQERASGEGRLVCDVDIVFFR